MRPYTDKIQKTMIPVHGKPLLDYIVSGLIHAGFKELVLVVNYRKDQIIDYFKDGSQLNINIEYVEQEELNGTGGALLACKNVISDSHLFLTWGDVLVPYRIYKIVRESSEKHDIDFILVSNYKEDLSMGGAIYCDGDFCVKIVEKEPKGTGTTQLNNCGIFVLSNEIFKALERIIPSERGELELTSALNYGISNYGWKVRIVKMDSNTFRGDFGNIQEYERLNKDASWIDQLLE